MYMLLLWNNQLVNLLRIQNRFVSSPGALFSRHLATRLSSFQPKSRMIRKPTLPKTVPPAGEYPPASTQAPDLIRGFKQITWIRFVGAKCRKEQNKARILSRSNLSRTPGFPPIDQNRDNGCKHHYNSSGIVRQIIEDAYNRCLLRRQAQQ